jgi:hypothetical protein
MPCRLGHFNLCFSHCPSYRDVSRSSTQSPAANGQLLGAECSRWHHLPRVLHIPFRLYPGNRFWQEQIFMGLEPHVQHRLCIFRDGNSAMGTGHVVFMTATRIARQTRPVHHSSRKVQACARSRTRIAHVHVHLRETGLDALMGYVWTSACIIFFICSVLFRAPSSQALQLFSLSNPVPFSSRHWDLPLHTVPLSYSHLPVSLFKCRKPVEKVSLVAK